MRLVRWYVTPTGLLYVLVVGAAVVITLAVSTKWGVVALAIVSGAAIPFKLAHLESARTEMARRMRDNERAAQSSVDERSRALDEVAVRLSAIDQHLAELDAIVAEVQPRLKQVAATAAERAQAARRDAVAAIDTARHEWSALLRAERRRAEANIDRIVEGRSPGPENDPDREPASS